MRRFWWMNCPRVGYETFLFPNFMFILNIQRFFKKVLLPPNESHFRFHWPSAAQSAVYAVKSSSCVESSKHRGWWLYAARGFNCVNGVPRGRRPMKLQSGLILRPEQLLKNSLWHCYLHAKWDLMAYVTSLGQSIDQKRLISGMWHL